MIVKMIKNLENKMETMQESVNKDLEELKNKHTETNNKLHLQTLQRAFLSAKVPSVKPFAKRCT